MAENDRTQANRLIRECQETQNPYLDLGNCGITDLGDLPELFECTHLQTLILANEWWDWQKRKWMQSANSGLKNQLTSLSPAIISLKKLSLFNLSGKLYNFYQISDIQFLEKLTGLQTLDLSYNRISDIQFLEKLTGLKTLDLSDNQISDIRFLEKLTGLKTLDLSSNQISDIRFLEKLTGLQSLDLSYNKISDYRFLEKLTELQALYLHSNQISDYRFLEKLTGLQSLNLHSNQISDIRFLEKLTGLQSLNLHSNQISDIRFLEKLTGLQTLDLSSNQIEKVSQNIFRLNMKISLEKYGSGLNLFENPIESPPLEILKQGRQAVLDWFEANRIKLEEIKIILIGDPKAGKTSLLRRLKDNTFDPNEVQTDGVNIEDIQFGESETFQKYEVLHSLTGHFWDFGGQEIMTATHQFFLTKRCVYILVLDARKDDNTATQIRQWVKRIKATGGNVAIIVVANQVDINTAFGFDNEFELQQEFPQIKAFIKASCKTSENIERIKDELAELIPQADLFNTEIDERWMHIKDQLQKETKQKFFLDENRFTEICQANELADKAGQHNAITFLHDLGLVLHFEDLSKELSEFFVLDPYWITYGVYQILTSKRAGEVNGRVPMEQLEYIVNEEEAKEAVYQPKEHKKITYTKSQREFLVDILHEFKLCFRSPDRCEFILPDLLPTKEPEIITHPLRTDSEAIRFVYQYDYLPNSLMPRIIVETHRLQQESWRTGCVLGYNGSMALISAYQSRISLTVSGEPRKKYEFMAIIRHLLDTINSTLSDQPDMLIPLPGTTEFADYEELLERERDGERDYTIYKPVKKKFNISELLQGVASQYEIAMLSRQVDILTDKVDDVQESLDRYFEKLMQNPANARLKEDILNALQENSIAQIKEINREIIDFLAVCFEHLHGDIDSELQEIYAKLHKTSNVQMKLKLAVPLLNLLGVKFETEVDLKGWAKKMDKKYKMPLFKSLGLLS